MPTDDYEEMIEQVARENAETIRTRIPKIFDHPIGTEKAPKSLLKDEWAVRDPKYITELYEKAVQGNNGNRVRAALDILSHDKSMRGD